jgi:NAD+ kinase
VAEQIRQSFVEKQIDATVTTTQRDGEIDTVVEHSDVVIAIGGDGAMLRAARVCAPRRVPLLGLNMGKLGFLTEVASIEVWGGYLDRLLRGDYWIENRMMLDIQWEQSTHLMVRDEALNDIVISGDRFGHMIQLDTYIDGTWTTTYNSDALIIATPTGSTAYALAVGGPILPPQVQNILLVPAAAHLSMDRAIVLSEGSRVEVHLAASNRHPVVVALDGRMLGTMNMGETLHICASEHKSRFIRMRDTNYFYRSLLDRLEPRMSRAPGGGDEG